MPENGPSSSWSHASISRMSTISRSPGCAPSTRNGPLRTCTPGSGAWRTSSAESSLLIAPSNHSRQSARNTSPGLTVTFGGMSGCHRLCPTCFWSVNFFVLSSGNRLRGMDRAPWSDGRGGTDAALVAQHPGRGGRVRVGERATGLDAHHLGLVRALLLAVERGAQRLHEPGEARRAEHPPARRAARGAREAGRPPPPPAGPAGGGAGGGRRGVRHAPRHVELAAVLAGEGVDRHP